MGVARSSEKRDASELAKGATRIAIELRHPAYDRVYLALAERERTAAITAARRLADKLTGTPYAILVRHTPAYPAA